LHSVAGVSLLLLGVMGMFVTGLFTAAVYFLAGSGVRERSVPAAARAVVLYLTNLVGGFVVGATGNPLIQLIVLMLLFANLRGDSAVSEMVGSAGGRRRQFRTRGSFHVQCHESLCE
jgi:hypothetical protein